MPNSLVPVIPRADIVEPGHARPSRTVLLDKICTDRAVFDDHPSSAHYRRFDAKTQATISRKPVVLFRLGKHAKGLAGP